MAGVCAPQVGAVFFKSCQVFEDEPEVATRIFVPETRETESIETKPEVEVIAVPFNVKEAAQLVEESPTLKVFVVPATPETLIVEAEEGTEVVIRQSLFPGVGMFKKSKEEPAPPPQDESTTANASGPRARVPREAFEW